MKLQHKKVLTLITTGTLLAVATSILAFGGLSVNKVRPSRSKPKRTRIAKKITATKKVTTASSSPIKDESSAMKSILASTTGLQPNVLKLGLKAYHWASKHADVKKPYLTIVDFTTPSKNKRLWVINLNTDKVVMKELVANGKNSGLYNGTRFSNAHGTLESSLGVYLTGVTYYGTDGLSLHVHGLQPGINTNAYSRTVEFHGAWYVTPQFAKKHGRVGRSYGCFAMDKAILPQLVNTIRNGSVVFAYAVNHHQDFSVEGA